MIQITDLSFEYSGDEKVLRNINLKTGKKGFFSLVGLSGCGKSTLCLALNGLIPHEIGGKISGKVEVSGLDTQKHPIKELATHAGMVFQNPESQLFALSAEDEIAFGPSNLALPWDAVEKRVTNTLRLLKIEHLKDKSPEEMSSGEKQKVAIASALAMEPEILVLDEPTANLDPASTEDIFRLLKKLSRDMLVFVAEHDIAKVLEYSDMVAVMDKGSIVTVGSSEKILNDSMIDKYLYLPKICRISKKMGIFPIVSNASELAQKTRLKRRPAGEEKRKIKCESIIEIKDLWFEYKDKTAVLKNINLDIKKGEFVAIVGQNGAGKSTLALHLNGLLKPMRGDIIVDGKNTKDEKVSSLSKIVGYAFQNPELQFFEDTLTEEISFGPKNLGLDSAEIKSRAENILKYTGLDKFKDKDPFSLSMGQKRRLSIASILSMEPKVIVIDEPSTGLDIKTTDFLMKLVKKLNSLGHTIIMITHDMELVSDYAERVIVMKNGEIIGDGSIR
ncbi:MAG: energy-coupling factor ABC transporter ATP-binding protein, partial [Candidatus Aenigmarchaeota archaeon]|nr:energy-coupling factor ABC transporter ATP-binding protein [Candidatus Aenigmarchaeota archaeon]